MLDLIRPDRVIDVCCGICTRLFLYIENGLIDNIGIDGNYIDVTLLSFRIRARLKVSTN